MNLIPYGTGTSDWADVTVTDSAKSLHVTGNAAVNTAVGMGEIEIAHVASNGYRTVLACLRSEEVAGRGVLAVTGSYSVRRVSGSLGVEVEG